MYEPLDPTESNSFSSQVFYREFSPDSVLLPYVHSYWECEAHAPIKNLEFRCVPNGCIDISLNCLDFESLLLEGTIKDYLAGTTDLAKPMKMFGIRFKPGGFAAFFPIPLKEISAVKIPIVEVVGKEMKDIEQQLFAAGSTVERIKIVNAYFISRLLSYNTLIDHRFLAALDKIYRCNGQITIEDCITADISPRQLRRLFDRYIGLSPKNFAKIIRFQSVLKDMIRKPKQSWVDLYVDYGYYDQPHFINDFREFFGVSPTAMNLP